MNWAAKYPKTLSITDAKQIIIMMTLQHIAGYTTPRTVWKMMADLTSGWQPGRLSHATPKDISIEGDRFQVMTTDGKQSTAFAAPETFGQQAKDGQEAAEAWTLGALVFYVLMGMHVFEGKGGLTQTASTVVPRIGSQHCPPAMSQIVYRCLSFDPAARPSLSEVHQTAVEALAQKPQAPKRLVTAAGTTYKTSLVSFWPEEMVTAVILFFLMLLPMGASAQASTSDEEVVALVQRCIDMRLQSNLTKVQRQLSNDYQWTMMDEIDIDREGECTTKDSVATFGINALGFRISKYHGGVVNAGGRFNNGQDARYNYSFIEITVKKGRSVSYDITGREGYQLFAIVPYHQDAAYEVSAKKGSSNFGTTEGRQDNGVQFLTLNERVNRNDTFTLTIKNNSDQNQSFVIINHNTRK